jgi:predicted ATPase
VGGLPLAIRLAASWASSLSCAEIATEIRHSLDILSHKPLAEADEAQSDVWAVFEQSWKRLFPSDQAAFAGLSVFRGGLDRAGPNRSPGLAWRRWRDWSISHCCA